MTNIYTIPAGCSFVDALAEGLMDMAGDDPLALARMHVLLPTRRACRTLRESFLRITNGKPLLLPRMNPIGDIDEEELSLTLSGAEEELSLPPSIHPMQRLFLMTRLINKLGHARGLEQDLALATALARLMDQIYTEDLDLADLPKAIDRDDFAEHWQISIDFLKILSEHWPLILAERGVIDAADRRNRLIKQLCSTWQKNPPAYPVIAAGTTGTIPATRMLLEEIKNLPKGYIVLPGLEQTMDAESWKSLDDTHPQKTLKTLLTKLDTDRHDVKLWSGCADLSDKSFMQALTSEIMRPAETTQDWQTIKDRLPDISSVTLPITRYDCANPQEEALTIAIALRAVLEDKNDAKTAALITPDRKLARRVVMACRRWNIDIDDSGGQALSDTTVGTYLRLCLQALCNDMKPVALMDFCKHTLCSPPKYGEWRGDIRALDKYIMRGPAFEDGFKIYRSKIDALKKENRKTESFEHTLSFVENGFAPLLNLKAGKKIASFTEWSEAHIAVCENFCKPDILWAGTDGEGAATLFSDLRDNCADLPDMNARDYFLLIERIMKGITIRPAYGLHPRLSILGQLEARLVHADVMILGGLNEGTWPGDPGVDPWMSRPMRNLYGLPPIERSIGLSAHDFAQGLGASEIILTRSTRVDGTPTVPSRWLQRMDTVLEATGLVLKQGDHLSLARTMDLSDEYKPIERPAPRPPVDVRPRALSATRIETWMNDPYGIYARYILNLKPLDNLEKPLDAAMRGDIIHKALYKFTDRNRNDLPLDAQDRLIRIMREELENAGIASDIRAFWEPRLLKTASWIIECEDEWRTDMKPGLLEATGSMTLNGPAGEFTLSARADRIDFSGDGRNAAIIDYKSGGSFSIKGMVNGKHPQLPLEAIILENAGFNGKTANVTHLAYWIVNGGGDGGDIRLLQKPADVANAKDNARQGLQDLIDTFDKEETPYYSLPNAEREPAYNDYKHLARVSEWKALDDQEDAA